LEITDLAGRIILTQAVSSSSATLHIGALQKGIYLLKIHTADACYTRRVMLMR
jgi:hypothetical protein